MNLSPDQLKAQTSLLEFITTRQSNRQSNLITRQSNLITLGGYAGTGKTTLLAHTIKRIRSEINQSEISREDGYSIAFCAYTGKASSVLRGKLNAQNILTVRDTCSTIHSLIYKPIIDPRTRKLIGFKRVPDLSADLIVLDEASMVDEKLFNDLSSYGVPIIAVGDHGQLPPVKGQMNLVQDPQLRLEKIHRQAETNPIIRLSRICREEGTIQEGSWGPGVVKLTGQKAKQFIGQLILKSNEQIICGWNKTRVGLNRLMRDRLHLNDPLPLPGDRLICLQNKAWKGLYNGMMVEAVDRIGEPDENCIQLVLRENGKSFNTTAWIPQFNAQKTLSNDFWDWMNAKKKETGMYPSCNLFDYAYAISVWKSQGSQFEHVIFSEEYMPFLKGDQYRKFLYTAITRASERLTILKL